MFRKKTPRHSSKKGHHKDDNLLQHLGHEIEEGIKNFEHKVEKKIEHISHEISHDIKIATKKIKKKIDLFYKVSFFILLTLSIVLAYFVILVSTTPKSFSFVNNEIREKLYKNYGDAVVFDDAYLSFTRYGTLKISFKNLKISKSAFDSKDVNAHQFLIPHIEGEFSLLNLINSSFVPRKIKISDPEIVLNDLWEKSSDVNNADPTVNPLEVIVAALSALKAERLLTKNFEIENAKLVFNSADNSKRILIKKSQIRTFSKNDVLYISATNRLSFSDAKNDVELNSSCQLAQYNILKCDVFLVNFVANSVSDFYPKLKPLEQINAMLNSGISFTIDSGKLHNISFKAEAKKGNFSFPEFFGERLFFSDFAVKGDYDDGLAIMNLSEIKGDFMMHDDADNTNPKSLTLKTHLDMSLLISNVKDPQNNHSDFYIKLRNAPTNELEKLWPVFLQDNGIRQWVIEHITNGVISDAYTRFSLDQKEGVNSLEKIDAELNFKGLDLKYGEDFPQITAVNGAAKFTAKDMKINISAGNVLNSTIYDSKVEIDDFQAPITMLKILGKSKGDASDSLKHVDNSSKFAAGVKKYLNGNSQNNFNIQIPLDSLSLKHSYIEVNSAISGLKNDYVKGAVSVALKKDFASEKFVTAINLTDAELNLKEFDIAKNIGDEGALSLNIIFPTAKKIELSDVLLSKKQRIVTAKRARILNAKITGNIKANTAPFAITDVNLKNQNFGRNSYKLSYKSDKKTLAPKVTIRGQVLDLAPFIQNKFSAFSGGNNSGGDINALIAVDNLLLANSKSIRNFYFALKCGNKFCYSGALKGSYNKKHESLSLRLSKQAQENFSKIEGQITDIGYLAEALGISNVVSGGNANLDLQHKLVAKKPLLEGKINFSDSITIYENHTVKRLASNSLFSKVRDKIFSEDKTIFDSMKMDLSLYGHVLTINSLIANNYKIGITAKGAVDLKNDTYQIKGMIVPGFMINNLFGIGKIPILGNVVGLLTGGEGGGLFGIRYEYVKQKGDKEAKFETNKISSFVPTTIKNLFDLI